MAKAPTGTSLDGAKDDSVALNSTGDIDNLISQVYDVALDASRYDTLRETWESLGDSFLKNNENSSNAGTIPGLLHGHFDRAMLVMQQMDYSSPQDNLQSLLAPFDKVAAIIITKELTVAALNNPAKNNLGLSVGSKLSSLPIESFDLDVLAKQASKMLVDSSSAPSIYRFRSTTRNDFIVIQMRRVEMTSSEPVVVAVTSDLHWPSGFEDVLRDAFSLSSAEADVVRLLIDCSSVKEIAEKRGRSIDTIRAQVKAILAKTETKSQIELVRVVLSMMDIASSAIGDDRTPQQFNIGGNTLKTLPYHTVYDENDRRLDYLILGDPKGKPLLYITAEYCYIRWTGEAERAAEEMGMKVIVPVRAGYGSSDNLPKDQDFCEGIAKDILCVLDAEGVTSLPSISMSDDHNFVIQVEKLRPGTIRALIGAPGAFPFLNEEQVYRMHKWYRFIQACARNTPSMLPYMLKMGFHLVKRIGKKSFLQTIYEDSPADIAAIADPDVFEALDCGSEAASTEVNRVCETFARQTIFEQDPALVDHVHWCRDRLPVHFFCGLQDPSQPSQTLEEQMVEFDWVDFRVLPDAGQLLFFTKWRDVLRLAKKYL